MEPYKSKIVIKIKEAIEFVSLDNISRSINKSTFSKMNFDFSNLSYKNKLYVINEIRAVNNHTIIQSNQKILWKNNTTSENFESQIININTTTHNESVEGINLWLDKEGREIYLNNVNIKFCNIEDKPLNKFLEIEEEKFLLNSNDLLINNIDYRMYEWLECMKKMKNENKCFDVMFWKKNIMNKTEFYINNMINTDVILDKIEFVSTTINDVY